MLNFGGVTFPIIKMKHQQDPQDPRPELPGALEKCLLVRVELAWIVTTQHKPTCNIQEPRNWQIENNHKSKSVLRMMMMMMMMMMMGMTIHSLKSGSGVWGYLAAIRALSILSAEHAANICKQWTKWPCFMTRSWNYALWNNLPQKTG